MRLEKLDKLGNPIEIREGGLEFLPQVTQMYDEFHPRGISQGLPPARDEDCRNWIRGLMENGWNFLCFQEGRVVGHAAILPDLDRADGEYIIFVQLPYRNRGMGSELTAMAVERARLTGLKVLWLTVESINFRAIRVYKKSGFLFCDEGERERTMILRL